MKATVEPPPPAQPRPLRTPDSPLGRKRQARGWSQSTLARALTLQAERWGWKIAAEDSLKVFVSRWENDCMRPNPTYQVLLCAVLRSTPEELGLTGARARRRKQSITALNEQVRELQALVCDLAARVEAASS